MNRARQQACILCAGRRFESIPTPWHHSMTTAGRFVDEPLSKAQCNSCGLLQRVDVRQLGQTDFYEHHYGFYERPGAAIYDKPRYRAMAEWIRRSVPPFEPESILDVGCGRGWMMGALRGVYPNSAIQGVEPSEQESEKARATGHDVRTGRVDSLDWPQQYDLVYATNVIEHTTDPVGFLRSLRNLVRDDGLILILCPDSTIPSAELMFSDQNYSFTARQLAQIAQKSQLSVVNWMPPPETISLKNKQLIVLSKKTTRADEATFGWMPAAPPERLLVERKRYVESYIECERHLLERVAGYTTIYNFGSSTWSLLLAAYCPAYWSCVSSSVIDGGSGTFQGKPVLSLAELPSQGRAVFVLGVNPLYQQELANRLEAQAAPCVRWDHIIKC